MGILGHRDREARRPWGKAEIAYVCEHGSRGEAWASVARALNRSESSCGATFFRHATTHERGLRDQAIDGGGDHGRPAGDPDPIVLTEGALVGDCFANDVDPRDRVGRPL